MSESDIPGKQSGGEQGSSGLDPQQTLSIGSAGEAAGQIGPYRLLRALGAGGMGEVWLAEQTKPLHRTVALKLIKAGMDTKAVVARFESERQALALMEHPNIAHVFDAGATPEGRPYFVMEYVPGIPINEYCDKHRLTVKERLDLFAHVCEGVQHAHQKAIIHRDLKPSNVLVIEQSDKPVPKIIDFGLAKAAGAQLTDATMFTQVGVMVGTPEYMSPEQADLREQNIDTRTDVYSLGVILYELLVGVLPFESKELRAAGLEAVLRVIREQDPPKPSTKIRSMGEGSKASAERRKEEPRTFARHLRGELDWITMKALEKDRGRRYGSPSELASDISRYLKNEAVVAGPPSAAYRARKFVVRHRFGVLAAATGVVLLLAFSVVTAVQARRIAKERDRANREAAAAERVADFMTKMFKVSDPGESRGNSITARELLDKAAADIDKGLASDPELQARMMYTMADVYEGLGLYKPAGSLALRAYQTDAKILGEENPTTLQAKSLVATLASDESRYTDAEKLYREVVEGRRKALGPDDRDTLKAMSRVALALDNQGRYADAEKLNREALAIAKKKYGEADKATLAISQNLAIDLAYQGKYSEAEQMFREIARQDEATLGKDHPDVLGDKTNIGSALLQENKLAEAESIYREVLEAKRRVLGPEHPATLLSMGNLGLVVKTEGRLGEAEGIFREVLAIKTRTLGAEHRSTLVTAGNLAQCLMLEKKYGEAEKLMRSNLDIERRVLGPDHYDTIVATQDLAVLLSSEGHFADSEKLYRQILEYRKRVLGADHRDTANVSYDFGCVLARDHKPEEALEQLRYAVEHGLDATNDLHLAEDSDLKSLHGLPAFTVLVEEARQRAAAQTSAAQSSAGQSNAGSGEGQKDAAAAKK